MKPGVPWSVKGIDAEAREAAKEAARRSGQTLGEWLNGMILDSAEPEEAPPPRYRPQRPMARDMHAGRARSAHIPPDDPGETLQLRMDELAAQLSGLTTSHQDTAVSRFQAARRDPVEDRAALGSILERIEQSEQQHSAAMERVNERLSALNTRLTDRSEIADDLKEKVLTETKPRLESMETAMRNIVGHIETSEKQTYDTLRGLQDRMAEMANRAAEADSKRVSVQAPQLASLEDRMQDLANRLERVNRDSRNHVEEYVEDRLSQVSQQVDAVRQSAEASQAQALSSTAVTVRQEIEQAERRLQDYMAEAAREAAAPVAQQMQQDLQTVAERVDTMQNEGATLEDVRTLHEAMTQISSQVAKGPDLSPLVEMERRLVELGNRLDEGLNDNTVSAQVVQLEQRVQQLDQQLRAAMQQQNDPQAFGALEQQIASVGDRLGATEQRLAHLATIEQSVNQLYESMEQNRAWAGEAAEAAAERMAQQIMANQPQVAAGPSPELTALEQGLAAVKASSEGADQRTQETLEAVHETLEQIIDKLGELEQAQSAAPAPAAANVETVSDVLNQPAPADTAPQADPAAWQSIVQTQLDQDSVQPGPDAAGPSADLNNPDFSEILIASDDGAPPQEPGLILPGNDAVQPADGGNAEPAADDFIAAARRAAAGAAGAGPAQEQSNRLLDRLRRASNGESAGSPGQADDGKDEGGSRFSLSFLNRRKADKPEDVDLDAEAAAAGGSSRTRLILAGLVLLAAVSAYSFGGVLGGGGDKSVSSEKTVPGQTSRLEAVPPPAAPAAGSDISEEDRKLVRALVSQANKADAMPATGMPRALVLDAAATNENAAAVPADNVETGSLPPPAADAPLGPRIDALPSAAEGATSSTEMPPEELGSASLRKAAADGDANAQFVIASRYLDGKTVSRDFAKAISWYELAARQGLAPAQYRLGTLYERGKGIARDMDKARAWYELAASKGNVKAMHNLAVIYANSQDGKPDMAKAAHWFKSAAEHGLRDSQYNLAVLLERGLGVQQNSSESYFWFGLAARQGDKDAATKQATLKNFLTTKMSDKLNGKIKSWQPKRPDRAGNFVAIGNKDWNVASAPKPQATNLPDLEGKELVKTIQQLLTKLGYDVGKPDGVMGSRTSNAIRLYQLQSGLVVNGSPSNLLLHHLQKRQT